MFDCAHPARLARFWAGALQGYALRPYDAAEIEPPGAARGRLHFDVVADDRPREVERLRALGATLEREADGYTVLCNAEGNRFCVADPR